MTIEGLQAELECWQIKLADLQAVASQTDSLDSADRSFALASIKLQERVIREQIDLIQGKLAFLAATSENRPSRKRLRARGEAESIL